MFKSYLAVAAAAIQFLSAPVQAEPNPQELFSQLCSSCHAVQGMPTNAPPIFGVINHVRSAYPERQAFVQRIVDWVAEPDPRDTLMPGAVRRFGLMPKLGYDPEDVRVIAEYLYSMRNRPPAWYREHYRQEHGHDPVQ